MFIKICAIIAALLTLYLGDGPCGKAIKLFFSDGSDHIFQLDDVPTAKFVGDAVVISGGSEEVRINVKDSPVVRFVYLDDPVTIEDTELKSHPIFHVNASGIEVSGLEPFSSLYLYNPNGTLVERVVADNSGYARIVISNHGIFIVKTSVSSFKIKK